MKPFKTYGANAHHQSSWKSRIVQRPKPRLNPYRILSRGQEALILVLLGLTLAGFYLIT